MTSHIRIKSNGMMGHNTKVFYIGKDGSETEISDVLQAVYIKMKVGEITKAYLHSIKVEFDVEAEEQK